MKHRKLLALLLAVCMVLTLLPAIAVADTVTVTDTVDPSVYTTASYASWTCDGSNSTANYAGYSYGNKNYIQLKSKDSISGIVSTVSGGKVKSVTITVNKGENSIGVYGSNTAYNEPSDLYGDNKGTLVGTVNATGTVTFTEDFNYVGIRSENGAVYLSKVDITWETEGSVPPTPDPFTITFNPNGGELEGATTAQTKADGTLDLEALPTPTREGYVFLGWYEQGETVPITLQTVFTADTTVTAQWEEDAPGTGDTYAKVKDTPADWSGTYLIVYDKYIFDGTDNAGNKTTLATAPGDSITGNYATSEIVIDQMEGGYSLFSANKEQYMSGKGSDSNGTNFSDSAFAATLSMADGIVTITSNTNIFAYNSSSGQERFRFFKSGTVGTGSGSYKLVSLYKKGGEQTTNYTVSFNANGGEGTMDPVTKADNTVYTVPANGFTAPEGYRFIGWKVNNEGDLLTAEVSQITITGDVELYAQWEEIELFTVTFNANGGTVEPASAQTGEDGKLASLPTPTREGHTFLGWFTLAEGGEEITLDRVYTENTTIFAHWAEVLTATLMSTLPDTGDRIVIFNPAYGMALDACGTSGYYNAGVSCTPVNFVINATENILWDVTKVSDGVYKFSQNGHFLSMGDSYGSTPYDGTNQEWKVEVYGDGYSIMNTVRECYLEWYASNNYFSGYASISNNGMFTFQFYKVGGTAPVTYTVHFNAGSGTGTMADVEDVTSPYVLPECEFTAPDGYEFAGWIIEGGDGTVYPAQTAVEINGETTFVAQWTKLVTKTYQLVTDEAQLAAGGKYIMVGVNGDEAYALSKISNNTYYREIVEVPLGDGQIVLSQNAVAAAAADQKVFELTLGGSAAYGWTFNDAFNGYLCATSSENNNMGVQQTADENGKFFITIDANGLVTAVAENSEYERNQIRYNSETPRFSCYGTSSRMKLFYLYKLVDPITDGYYMIGENGWTVDTIDPMKQFTQNPGNDQEYMLKTTVTEGLSFKVVKVENGTITGWYPDGMDNDYVVGANQAGTVMIYFRPNGQDGEPGWHYGKILIESIYEITCVSGEHGLVSTENQYEAPGSTVTVFVETDEGYELDTLTVMCGETAVETTKVSDEQYTFTMPAGDVTVTATFKEIVTDPSFEKQSLVLDGKIGVNFFMNLDALSDTEKQNSYMTFAITGNGGISEDQVPFNANFTNKDKTLYGFTCYVRSIQMADTITATFHYGEDQTIEKKYAVKEYFTTFDANVTAGEITDTKLIALVYALADYGHYVQQFLAAKNGLTFGENGDYADMDKFYATEYDIDTVSAAVANKAIIRTNDTNGDVTAITYSVRLDSDVSIEVYFKVASGYDNTFTVKLDNEDYTAEKVNGRYVVKIKNIAANMLAAEHEINVTTAHGSAYVKVSVLSYVDSMLKAYTDAAAQNAAAAIYYYSKAADDYMAD